MKKIKLNLQVIYITALILFIVISNLIWLKIDTTPQRWDESIHLNASSGFLNTLKTNPIRIFKTFITQENFYPPLVPFLGAFFGLFNPEQDNFTHLMIIFHIILIIFTFLFAQILFDEYSAICAATLVISFPLIFTEGHYFMFDLPLTSLVIMATYFLFKTDYFLNKKYCFLFFITSGLGM
ncbi:MAG: glycosyltransferase family 39 protein, partial [Candidatus Goldbacteria bacterium]|nr:glycosyltransferase family 39 protein [Candidatus Goldiibacteriota bacterium]